VAGFIDKPLPSEAVRKLATARRSLQKEHVNLLHVQHELRVDAWPERA
jgi:hypothetical protein